MNMEATIGGQSSQERFHTVRNNAASIIGNGVISLLWQLSCHCDHDHDKFSSLSNTTLVAIFPNVCLWQLGLCSNLAGVDREKLYRGTFICQDGLCCCSFRLFCENLGNLHEFFGQMVYRPPWPNCPYAYGLHCTCTCFTAIK